MIDFINIVSLYVWGSFTVFLFLGLLSLGTKPKYSSSRIKKHEFVLVSVAANSVFNSLIECIEYTKRNFPESTISILIDQGSELESYLLSHYSNVIVVPKQYRQDLLAKGRAIHYFIENRVKESFWYSFIDDDNLVLDDFFLYEIPEMEKKGFVAMNPVLKAREGKSKFTYLMDSIRYFDDITIFRFFTGLLSRPVLGLHGELLTVKGSVLKEIGFDRHSLTEDFRFASEIVRAKYKVWQSKTVVSVKSPNTISDLLRQRGRWFKGIVKDLPYVPFSMKLLVGWRITIWCLGIFGSWLFAFCWLRFHYTSILLMFGGLYFWFIYLWQIGKSRYYRYSILIPLFGVLETASFMYGLKQKRFVVINKS